MVRVRKGAPGHTNLSIMLSTKYHRKMPLEWYSGLPGLAQVKGLPVSGSGPHDALVAPTMTCRSNALAAGGRGHLRDAAGPVLGSRGDPR